MEERFVKLDALLEDEAKATEVFSGTIDEARAKLARLGIEFTEEEFAEFLDGIKTTLNKNSELNENDLEQVAGGCSRCKSHGQRVGEKIGRILNIVKWLGGLLL